MRLAFLLVVTSLTLPVSAHAGSPAKVHRAVAAKATAQRAPGGARVFEVRVRGRASAVVVCDVGPFVCRVAERGSGRRWRVVLPSGPAAPGLPASPGHPPEPTPVAGAGPRFRIVVYAYQGPRFTSREFGGRYA